MKNKINERKRDGQEEYQDGYQVKKLREDDQKEVETIKCIVAYKQGLYKNIYML